MRRMMMWMLTGCTLISGVAIANEKGSGPLPGEDLYNLKAPKGWKEDAVEAKSHHFNEVFLPGNESWDNASAVMYTGLSYFDPDRENIYDVINYDIENYQMAAPGLTIDDGEPITLGDGSHALVIELTDEEKGTYETIAYVEGNSEVFFVVLSARSKDAFDKEMAAFQELVASYKEELE